MTQHCFEIAGRGISGIHVAYPSHQEISPPSYFNSTPPQLLPLPLIVKIYRRKIRLVARISLNGFPVELLHLVCSKCSKSDIRNLRLTSRLIGAVADEHFLHNVTIFSIREEFEMIEEIVKNPRVAKGLREVRFQADRMQTGSNLKVLQRGSKQLGLLDPRTYKDDDEAEAELPHEIGSEREKRQKRREVVRRRMPTLSQREMENAYWFHRFDQSALMEEERAQTCFQRLFNSCPKLDAVTVAMLHTADDVLSKDVPWHSVKAFQEMKITPYRDPDSSRIGTRSLNETLTAACRADKKLKSLRVSPISYQFFAQDEETMADLYSAISDLESVHITMNEDFRNDRDEEALEIEMQQMEDDGMSIDGILEAVEGDDAMAIERVLGALKDGRVARFLHHAPSLREISIEGPMLEWPFHEDMVSLKDLVGSQPPWQGVTKLKLSDFSCHWKDLVSLILRYRDTLEYLQLGMAAIDVEGDWGQMWSAIAGKMPNIKAVKIYHGHPHVDGYCRYNIFPVSDLETYIMTGHQTDLSPPVIV